jgi:hypothetical protein
MPRFRSPLLRHLSWTKRIGSVELPEKESQIHLPGRWILIGIGATFLLFGAMGFFVKVAVDPKVGPIWILYVISGGFCFLGAIAVVVASSQLLFPSRIKHFESDQFANVPHEPVLLEGSMVHGRLTHELVESEEHWELRPQIRIWTQDKRFLLGFGVPFSLVFSGILSWAFRVQMGAPNWPIAIAGAILLTLFCGVGTFTLIGMLIRASYTRLSRLRIPKDGSDLELDSVKGPDEKNLDLLEGLAWALVDTGERERLKIPAESLCAVQLCAWQHQVGPRHSVSTTSAVQGNLVLEAGGEFARVPLLVTADFAAAARLMHDLAEVCIVPFLYHASKEDWQAEKERARTRPTLKTGGSMS